MSGKPIIGKVLPAIFAIVNYSAMLTVHNG